MLDFLHSKSYKQHLEIFSMDFVSLAVKIFESEESTKAEAVNQS